ncbi:MAG: CotH kinase family protein, partial [Oscillospiraceae bacterium]|nr:CotH kinase family protein [Oscillospiraceae bacterium]
LAGELMDWAPNIRYCELFMDGVYQGLYVMTETVKVSADRVNITRVDNNSGFAVSYLLYRDRLINTPEPLNNFGTYAAKTFNALGLDITYPGPRTITDERAEYVRQDVGRFEKALYSIDYDTPGKGYREYIDVESFVDYYILNELSLNIDGGNLSTYAYKDLRGKLTMGPVWDFNNSFNCYEYYEIPEDGLYVADKGWYTMLFKDERFTEQVISRYHQLRRSILSEENILSLIDDTVSFLGPATARNDEVWGYSYADGWLDQYRIDLISMEIDPLPYDRNPKDYEEAVAQLKASVCSRGDFMDEHIEILRQFSAESAVKEWN